MKKYFPRPNGDVQGDPKSISNVGTGRGKTHHGQVDHGKNTSMNATNSMGAIKSDTKSDPMMQDKGGKNNG